MSSAGQERFTGTTVIGTARLIAAKDLRVELRSRVLLNQVLPFALIVMVMFDFALDSEAARTQLVCHPDKIVCHHLG